MPLKDIEFSLIWPILGGGYQPFSYRIVNHVFAFRGKAFTLTQLRIPALSLPKWPRMFRWKRQGHFRFPELHPFVKIWNGPTARRATEVNMVRHDNISSNKPSMSFFPCGDNALNRSRIGKDLLTLVGIYRNEKNDCSIVLADEN